MGLFTKDIESLDDLFVHQLQDIYYAENQITKALPTMIEKATSPQLKQGFQTHAPASADAGETKLLVRQGAIEVKIEVNFVMRGTVNPVRMASCMASSAGSASDRLRPGLCRGGGATEPLG